MHTPGLPVSRPWVAAMKAAACSCRVRMSLMFDFRSDSTTSRFSSPGMPKIRSTPSFSSAAISKSDPLVIVLLSIGLSSESRRQKTFPLHRRRCLNRKRQQAASFCHRGRFSAEFGAKRRHSSHQSLIRGGKVITVKPDIVLQAGTAVAAEFKTPSVHFILVPPDARSRPGRLGHQLLQLRDFELKHFSDCWHGVLNIEYELHMKRLL